ncbi:permease-like cell division protein FtsX [Streptococcus dentiloxodontae]
MIRNFFRHLWESLKNLKRNVWMTLAAVSSVAITLTLLGIFASILLNTQKLASDIEKNIQVNVYLDPDSTDASKTVVDLSGNTQNNENYHKVYNALKKLDGVDTVTFSSKDEQMDNLVAVLGDEWKSVYGDANPLSDAYIIQTKSPDDVAKVAKAAEKIDGIDNVNYGGTDSEQLMSASSTVQLWGTIATVLLIFVAVFLISNTIRITIMSRSTEIQIMRLVGAKNSYIRWPYFLEGAWIGALGAILPSALVALLYRWIYGAVNPDFVKVGISMYDQSWYLPALIASLFAVGIIIGSVGSMISMRRYLKY